ncbi:MAG: hypothetical protein HY556_11490 [Euryarchaeota archaeon]|nr:hypothetical protein [Euryarchaeota archaeon]
MKARVGNNYPPWAALPAVPLDAGSILWFSAAFVALIGLPGMVLGRLLFRKSTWSVRGPAGITCHVVAWVFVALVLNRAIELRPDFDGAGLSFLVVTVPPLLVTAWGLARERVSYRTLIPRWNQVVARVPALVAVAGVAAVVTVVTYAPHASYPLPIHSDEWIHWSQAGCLLDETKICVLGQTSGAGSAQVSHYEGGFHMFTALFASLGFGGEDAGFLPIFLLMPTAFALVRASSAFAIGRGGPLDYGLAAALLVAFIPTSTRFLGPGIYVPLAFGLFLLMGLLVIARYATKWFQFAFVPLTLLVILLSHPHSSVAGASIMVACAFLFIVSKDSRRKGLTLLASLIAAAVVGFALFPSTGAALQGIQSFVAGSREATLAGDPYSPTALYLARGLGASALVLVVAGAAVAVGSKRSAFEKAMLLAGAGYYSIVVGFTDFGLPFDRLYDRAMTLQFVPLILIAGLGLVFLLGVGERVLDSALAAGRIRRGARGLTLCVSGFLVVGFVLSGAMPAHLSEEYYRLVEPEHFENMVWLRDNIAGFRDADHAYSSAAVGVTESNAFWSITGIRTSVGIWPPFGTDLVIPMRRFLYDACRDQAFLNQHGITVVFHPAGCDVASNRNLTEIHYGIYLVDLPPR